MKPNRTEIATIAAQMKADIAALPAATGKAERRIGDYHLLLLSRDGSLRLHVGLIGRWPTLEETAPFARAFGVPEEDMDPTAQTQWLESRYSGKVRANTMRYAWREQLVPVPPPARPGVVFGAGPVQPSLLEA